MRPREEGPLTWPCKIHQRLHGALAQPLIGAVVGLVPAVGLGALRVLNGEAPAVAAQVAGNIAFTLVYASPYLLALIASRAGDPGVRGSLLAALGLLSLVAQLLNLLAGQRRPAARDVHSLVRLCQEPRSLGTPSGDLLACRGRRPAHRRDRWTRFSSPSGESKTTRPVAGSCLTTPTSPTGSPGPISGNLECSLPEPWTSTLAATARATSSQARKPPWASAPQSPPS